MIADPKAWYLCSCVDCGKVLKVQGQPPHTPVCLHCNVIRYAPEALRAEIRRTLTPLPEDKHGY